MQTSASTSTALSRNEYLKKYLNKTEDDKKNKKKSKKKKIKKPQTNANGVLVVDEDPVWGKPVNIEVDEEEEDSPDEKPQVEEDIEVKRMKRMDEIRARQKMLGDGGGWVVLSDAPSVNVNDGDLSPRRRSHSQTNEKSDSPDISPPRRNRPNSGRDGSLDEDISPPRRNRPNLERTDSVPEDISPPRRNKPHLSEDISPPRRNRPTNSVKTESLSGDISPPRRNRFHLSNDISPPRRNRPISQNNDIPVEDMSPPRRRRPQPEKTEASASPGISPPRKRKTNSKEEGRTGLLNAKVIKEEIEREKKEVISRYKKLDPSVSGRGAEPIYRDRAGNRMTKEEVLKSQKGEEKPKEKKLEWGKGLAQKREAEAKEQELELERERPFARNRDDPELDKMLKERVRWGDPMAHLVKGKQSDLILEDFGENEKMKESGFIIPQKVPSHSWIIRKLDAPPNRYGIKPGRHWDGVDRSNGYEKEFFKRTSEKQATEKEAYMWSVSDM